MQVLDKTRILSEMHRVLKDGGRLLAHDWMLNREPNGTIDQKTVEITENIYVVKFPTETEYCE